jgi:2-polyprenyl-6-methoxyphenol hydroxylase-like FAD-dependent oxidoreductase
LLSGGSSKESSPASGGGVHIDVLIVGAGPTGLMLANQLGRRGIRALIVDRHGGPAQQTRAMAVHARTLEIYDQLGVSDRALEMGRRGNAANLWANGRRTARIPLGAIGQGLSPFPFVLMLGQDDNERILGDKLRDWGMDVQWHTELVALEQRAEHVDATLQRADGSTRTVRASYVAGCDGVHSAVRGLNGIPFPGAPYEHVFFVADTEATGSMVPAELNVFLRREGFHLFFPMRGENRWRVIGILPEALRDEGDLSFDRVAPAIRRDAGANVAFHACSWFSTYRIHHRCADRFRERRCFLLGDAAHVHSPAGGQGMNTGLQDAYNLAWKLALVAQGRADERLLDSYNDERRRIALNLVRSTDRAFALLVSESRWAALFRTRIVANVVALAMRSRRARELAFRTISQIGIRYRTSPLSHNLAALGGAAVRAGDRFPWLHLRFASAQAAEDLYRRLEDTSFNLIVIGQPLTSMPIPFDDMRVHAVADDPDNDRVLAQAGIGKPAYFLLRPDGHVALAGVRLEHGEVERYLEERGIRLQRRHQRAASGATFVTELR